MVSNDLKKILNIEVLYITCASILAGALLTNAIIILSQIDLYKYVSVWVLLIYVGAMLLFGLLTANRLNGKIFKKSVYQSLKEGGEAA